ncbi:MAG: histidinol-phosphate transaminase [Armatimonadetes bacterium]|nr:histidinol-phosphate transaminase [Armatimonadota bacterium]
MSKDNGQRIEVAAHIRSLVPYQPGKPIEEVKRELGISSVTKLASNENPLGPSPAAVQAIRQAAAGVHLYPEGSCHDLRKAVAAHLGVDGEQLSFGNGSDEVIHVAGLAFLTPSDQVLTGAPTFVLYRTCAILNRCELVEVPLRDWTFDLEAMADRITERTRLVFIANPNNPTGTIVRRRELERFMDRLPERAILVLDEAYAEYVDDPEYPTSLDYIREGRNVLGLRTFSKIHGLAGVRLGYGIARADIAAELERVREPFNVSVLAQAAGIAALGSDEHVRRSLATNEAGKAELAKAFGEMGMTVTETHANFVWVDIGAPCRPVFQEMLKRGVILRTGDIFGADTHMRITVGTAEQNERCVTALREVLGK